MLVSLSCFQICIRDELLLSISTVLPHCLLVLLHWDIVVYYCVCFFYSLLFHSYYPAVCSSCASLLKCSFSFLHVKCQKKWRLNLPGGSGPWLVIRFEFEALQKVSGKWLENKGGFGWRSAVSINARRGCKKGLQEGDARRGCKKGLQEGTARRGCRAAEQAERAAQRLKPWVMGLRLAGDQSDLLGEVSGFGLHAGDWMVAGLSAGRSRTVICQWTLNPQIQECRMLVEPVLWPLPQAMESKTVQGRISMYLYCRRRIYHNVWQAVDLLLW